MCGGIASTISLRTSAGSPPQVPPPGGALARNVVFNAGRIVSYTVAGAIVGILGSVALVMNETMVVRQLLFAFANLMLIALGLYLAGLWHGVTALERGGALLWRRIQPLAVGMLRSPSLRDTFMLGALWGWIPCGLVYSMLAMALASAHATSGALIMFAFGLGTLPNLVAIGWAAGHAAKYFRIRAFRIGAGLVIAGFGAFGLWRLAKFANFAAWCSICGHALDGVRGFFGV